MNQTGPKPVESRSKCCGAPLIGQSSNQWCGACGCAPTLEANLTIGPKIWKSPALAGRIFRAKDGAYVLHLEDQQYQIGTQRPQLKETENV